MSDWDALDRHCDVLDRNCAARRALDLVADTWTALGLYALGAGACGRHMELRRQIDGITQKMLTQTLRRLEAGGLVERRDYAVMPPRVDYRLTALGESLLGPLDALRRWAEENADAVEAAAPVRETYARNPDYAAVVAAWFLARRVAGGGYRPRPP